MNWQADNFNPRAVDEGALAAALLPVARNILTRRLGPQTSQYAGEAALKAIRRFDPRAGRSFSAAFVLIVLNVGRDADRQFRGRAGSARRRTIAATVEVARDDPADAIDHAESLSTSLRSIDRLPKPGRWIALAAVLCDWRDHTTARICAVTAPTISRARLDLQRHVAAG